MPIDDPWTDSSILDELENYVMGLDTKAGLTTCFLVIERARQLAEMLDQLEANEQGEYREGHRPPSWPL